MKRITKILLLLLLMCLPASGARSGRLGVTFAQLNDVKLTLPVNNDTLTYNSATRKWENGSTVILNDGSILSTGTTDGYTIPSGAGTRMMWVPSKGAFRAGVVTGAQWNTANIGTRSVAFGFDGTASGDNSAFFGASGTASGVSSTHFGFSGTASGISSTHFGLNGTVSGDNSIHTGVNNIADSYELMTLGQYSVATSGDLDDWVATDPILVVGNGTGTGARSTALTIYKNGLLQTTSGRIKVPSRYTTTQTLGITDNQVACDTDGGAFTVTLLPGVAGTEHRIANTGTSGNDLTIAPDGAELLIGVNSNFTLRDGETLHIVYEATEGWF